MSALSLLHQLKSMGAGVWLRGDRLILKAPKHRLNGPLREALGRHRGELLQLLAEAEASLGKRRRTPKIARGQEAMPSLSQERLFGEYESGVSTKNHLLRAVHIAGPFDVTALEASLTSVIRAQDALQMGFRCDEAGHIVVAQGQVRDVSITLVDGFGLDEAQYGQLLHGHLNWMVHTPMDLGQPPLLRCLVLRKGLAEHEVIFVVHHIVSDGSSMAIWDQALVSAYRAFVLGSSIGFLNKRGSYQDYVYWQRQQVNRDLWQRQKAWWQGQLSGREVVRPWPRQTSLPERIIVEQLWLTTRETELVEHLARRVNGRVFTVLMACLGVWHYRVLGQVDLCLGTTVSHRDSPDWALIMGHFVDQMALRYRIQPDLRFASFLAMVSDVNGNSLDRRLLPFSEVRTACNALQQPLFRTKLVFHNEVFSPPPFLGTSIKAVRDQLELPLSQDMDWDLHGEIREGQLMIEAIHSSQVGLEEGTGLGDFLKLVVECCQRPDMRIADLMVG